MFVAWTTVPAEDLAQQLAAGAIAARLAVCVQIEGPITSHYLWQGVQEKSVEYRLTFKVLADTLPALETWVLAQNPYEIPEWIAVKAEHVGEKYLSWARAIPNNMTL